MSYIIRKSTEADLPNIVSLMLDDDFGQNRESENFSDYYSSYHQIESSEYFDIYVMTDEHNQELVGTYQIMYLPHLSFKGTKRAQIESVRIKSCLRGKGLGKKLVKHAIDLAREKNCGIFQLTSNKERSEQAHEFYKSLKLNATHEGYKLYFN